MSDTITFEESLEDTDWGLIIEKTAHLKVCLFRRRK